MKGKWRIVELPGFEPDYADMVEAAYIRFDGKGGGEFAFGCITAGIYEAGGKEHVEFRWGGSDEMDQVDGEGWAELQPDGLPSRSNLRPQRRRNRLHRPTVEDFFNSLLGLRGPVARRVVECVFAWRSRCRRSVKDFEAAIESVAAWSFCSAHPSSCPSSATAPPEKCEAVFG